MAKNNTPVIIGAALFGLLALGLTAFMLMGRGGGGTPPPPVAPVVNTTTQYTARRDIPPRTLITMDMLEPQDVPKDKVAAGAITDPKTVVGKMSSDFVPHGQVVTSALVGDQLGRTLPASFPIQLGMRAMSIYVDANATLGGVVDVGDHVDVIVSHKITITNTSNLGFSGDVRAARTIAQNLLVLAVDRSLNAPKPTPTPLPAAPGAAPAPPPPPPPAATPPPAKTRIILQAPPDIAERLVAAQESGIIYLSIRNPTSPDNFAIPEITEYPVPFSRTAPPKAQTASTTSGTTTTSTSTRSSRRRGGGNEGGSSPMDMPVPVPPTNPGSLAPNMTNFPGGGTAPPNPNAIPPDSKEVTVIRGTEKTRVIVPSNGNGG